MNDDIALITLSYPVWFTDEVRPVCLPSASDNFQKTTEMGVVAGWGRTDNGITHTVQLHHFENVQPTIGLPMCYNMLCSNLCR
jgi:hypothetical protein